MCGFGGSIWQTWRLIKLLNQNGYNVTALDFSKEALSLGDPALLPSLTDEVAAFAENEAKRLGSPPLLIGISLGALMSLNILRRSTVFMKGVLITGGDIVKVAKKIYRNAVWPQSYTELAALWQNVNMYTDPVKLRGKRFLFVLPARDKTINPEDVRCEVNNQLKAGNHITLIERPLFGHIGTIIEQTILFPKNILKYIDAINEA